MGEMTNQEFKVLESADELLREARRGVRYLDVISKAVAAYTFDERTRKAWDTFEREVNRLGFAEDPDAYCATCKGEGDVPDDRGRLDCCIACEGLGFLGYHEEGRLQAKIQNATVP